MTVTEIPDQTSTQETGYALGFSSLREEIELDRLEVEGELPGWLNGRLVRVTPAVFEIGETTLHWFDGLAMLNAFSFRDGRVSYANRFLETESYRKARDGELGFIGFASDPCRSLFRRVTALFEQNVNDNANVNVVRLGQRYQAMTEVPMPVEFDPKTLETLGLGKFKDRLRGQLSTAHPHYDFAKDRLVNYVTHFSARSSYRIFALAPGSNKRELVASIPVREPAYMHSFGMTKRYVILAEYPLVVNPMRLVASGRPLIDNYRWEPERGTRFIVVDKLDGGVSVHETESFFCFHHVNAFEAGNELVVDLVAYPDAEGIDATRIESLRDRKRPQVFGELRRYRIELSSGKVRSEPLSDVELELPRIDYRRFNARPYRCIYAASALGGESNWYDQLIKVDVETGEVDTWAASDCYPGEPVFVRAPESHTEDDGVVLSVVLDAQNKRSFLLVLDARDLQERARAAVSHHIPYGFHGNYFPDLQTKT
jgi:beta,beta-carotene 9',10'-dioxygenase